jgi:hypothetical protein
MVRQENLLVDLVVDFSTISRFMRVLRVDLMVCSEIPVSREARFRPKIKEPRSIKNSSLMSPLAALEGPPTSKTSLV